MSRRRSIVLAAGVVLLLAVVAIAAHGRPLGKSGGTGGGLPQTFWDYVLTTALILVVLAAAASFAALVFLRRERLEMRPGPYNSRTARTLAIVIIGAAVLFVIARHVDFSHLFNRNSTTSSVPAITSPGVPLGGRPGPQPGHLELPELVIFLALLLAAGAIYVMRSRGRPIRLRLGSPPPELLLALDESLDDLRADPDLRRAIIAAYARMEKALAAAGIPRKPAETPLEYLERVLRSLDTSEGAVRRLTDLFEWARFSQHEPEPQMRDEAIDALVAVRDELRAAEPVEAW